MINVWAEEPGIQLQVEVDKGLIVCKVIDVITGESRTASIQRFRWRRIIKETKLDKD
jgi:hypothetical protein